MNISMDFLEEALQANDYPRLRLSDAASAFRQAGDREADPGRAKRLHTIAEWLDELYEDRRFAWLRDNPPVGPDLFAAPNSPEGRILYEKRDRQAGVYADSW